MRRTIWLLVTLAVVPALAQEKKAAKDADLGKKETSAIPDKSLAGDVTRKKEERGAAPALQYDQFRLGVELQVASKRREQIDGLKRIIQLTPEDEAGKKERPKLLFRLGELYWEESKYQFFEANRKDDEYINAMNRKDQAAMERAKQDKEQLIKESKRFGALASDQYSEIVQKYKDFERTDEVLYFLGHNLMEQGEERKALVAYKRLIEKYPKSKFVPDAHLAFGEFYFNTSKGKKEMLEKALESYKKAASFPESNIYGFALYKQGWTYFNLSDCHKAMDMFKAVVLYGEIAGASALEKDGGKSGKGSLIREARNDFVRSFARCNGTPNDAKAEFAKLAKNGDDRFVMMKQLAGLYYEDGKDREAALAFNMLIREKPLSPEAPGFQGKIVDCVMRAGNKKMTVDQVRRLVKVMDDVKKGGMVKSDKDRKALEEAREQSERTISNLAVTWHNECKKTRDEECFQWTNEVYGDYLQLFPDNSKAYDLRFFWAELLNDNLQKYDKAAEQYTIVLMRDAACVDKGAKLEPTARAEKADKGRKGKKDKEKEDGEKKDEVAGKSKCPGKWMVNAAYNAVLAYDEVVKKDTEAGKIKTEAVTDPNKKLTIPPQKKALLEACERYVKYLPQGEKRVEIQFKAAKIYYDHNYLDEAVGRFADIALHSPDYKFENGDRAGEIAANLVLDSYNLLQDWAKVNEWARKFYAEERLATGKFRADLEKLIEQSAFKLVNQLEAKKEYCKAAEAYIGFVAEFPKSEIADKALYNAAIDYFNCKQIDKAIETRKRIIQNYPKSSFVPATIFAIAEGYEATADFENASEYYESYCRAFGSGRGAAPAPKASARRAKGKKGKAAPPPAAAKASDDQKWEEAKAQVACFNAGVFRDGLGQYKEALKDRELFLELFENTPDAEKVMLSIADLHERHGAYAKAAKVLEEYERKYIKDPNKVLTAEGKIAHLYENRMRAGKAARKVFDRILSYYEKLPSKTKKGLDITALDAVARAHFVTREEDYRKYTSMRLRWSKLTNVGEFKESLKEKAKALEQVQKAYTQTVQFKSADPAICALHRIGEAYDHMVKALLNAPTPRGMPEELKAEFQNELGNQAQPLKDKAAEAFAATVGKSQELDVFNECTSKALMALRETYRPEQFPKMGEDVPEVKGEFANMAIGADLLSAIQPIPTVSKEAAEGNKKRAAEVAKDVADVGRSKARPDGEEVPEPEPMRDEPKQAKKPSGGDDEPIEEEPL